MAGRTDEEIVLAARKKGAGRRVGIASLVDVARGDAEGELRRLSDGEVVDDCSVDFALKCRRRLGNAASPKVEVLT